MTPEEARQISAKVLEHLEGMNFPATKQEIIENAKLEHGPDTGEVIEFLSRLKKDRYESPAELMHEVRA